MKKALPFVLLGGAALLFCVGLVALGANFFLPRGDKIDLNQWKAPVDQVDAPHLTAANSLEVLAAIGDAQAIDDALQQADWESAFAAVAYGPFSSDANRMGTLLLLGSRYATAKQTAKAAWCYQYAATLAQVSPVPSDLVRAQTLVQAAQGLSALELSSVARTALDQAFLIAQYSTVIPRDSRAHLFEQISQQYTHLGVRNLATQARQKSEEASNSTAEDASGPTRTPYGMPIGELPTNKDLQAKIKDRATAAKELIDQLNLRPPKSAQDLPEDKIRALGDLLFEEDGLRQDFFDSQFDPTTAPPVQAAVLRDRIRWLSLKLRVARGAFGISLVSDWEPDAKKIATELSDTYDEFFKLSEQQAASTDRTADADRQVEDVLRAELVAGRWGLYSYDETDLRSRLGGITEKLRDDQIPTLRLDSYQRTNLTFYLLVPDELYGQGEKAFPQ